MSTNRTEREQKPTRGYCEPPGPTVVKNFSRIFRTPRNQATPAPNCPMPKHAENCSTPGPGHGIQKSWKHQAPSIREAPWNLSPSLPGEAKTRTPGTATFFLRSLLPGKLAAGVCISQSGNKSASSCGGYPITGDLPLVYAGGGAHFFFFRSRPLSPWARLQWRGFFFFRCFLGLSRRRTSGKFFSAPLSNRGARL